MYVGIEFFSSSEFSTKNRFISQKCLSISALLIGGLSRIINPSVVKASSAREAKARKSSSRPVASREKSFRRIGHHAVVGAAGAAAEPESGASEEPTSGISKGEGRDRADNGPGGRSRLSESWEAAALRRRDESDPNPTAVANQSRTRGKTQTNPSIILTKLNRF